MIDENLDCDVFRKRSTLMPYAVVVYIKLQYFGQYGDKTKTKTTKEQS
jgi:hypothetical protein